MEYLIRSAPTALPSGLRNAIETVGHLVAQRMPPSPVNGEFMGMTKYVVESFHDLLVGETESPSTSNSSRGAITPLVNVSWQVPPRDMLKASTREGLPQLMTLIMRSRGMLGLHLAYGWSS